MKIYGKLVKNTKIIKEAVVEKESEKAAYHELLESCLIGVCSELDIPVPLWLKKNTKEFAAYRKTFFFTEQFLEKIDFDRFEISVE